MKTTVHAQMKRFISPSRAFTLIELLVVISIIAILVGMLLPTLSKAKAKVQSIACLNKVKQLQYAWLIYTDEHHEVMPATLLEDGGGLTSHTRSLAGSWVQGNSILDVDTTNLQAGTLYPYLQSVDVFRCPTDKMLTKIRDGKQVPVTRTYCVNAALNVQGAHITPDPPRPFVHPKKLSAMVAPSPSQLWVFTEQSPITVFGDPIQAFIITQPLPHQAWGDLPTDRHTGGCNLSFADGHAEYHRWKAPKDKRGKGDPTVIQPGGDREDHTWLLNGLPRISDPPRRCTSPPLP